jgi:hypothetical protein
VLAAPPVDVVNLKLEAEAPRCRVEHAKAFGHDFFADTVARHRCDLEYFAAAVHGALLEWCAGILGRELDAFCV